MMMMSKIMWRILSSAAFLCFLSWSTWAFVARPASVRTAAPSLAPILARQSRLEAKRTNLVQNAPSINTMLKDFPQPVRTMGRMVSPLFKKQSKEVKAMVKKARTQLVKEPFLAEALGEPLELGEPILQRSSKTVVNGKTTKRVQASFQVAGSKTIGIAKLDSVNGKIRSLSVNVNGRTISVVSPSEDQAQDKLVSGSKRNLFGMSW